MAEMSNSIDIAFAIYDSISIGISHDLKTISIASDFYYFLCQSKTGHYFKFLISTSLTV